MEQLDVSTTADSRAQTDPKAIAVHRAELPLSCPRPDEVLWNMHPRVYLPIDEAPDGTMTCPYCGAVYRLVD